MAAILPFRHDLHMDQPRHADAGHEIAVECQEQQGYTCLCSKPRRPPMTEIHSNVFNNHRLAG